MIRYFLVILIFFFSALPALPELHIHSSIGFAGYFPAKNWFPLKLLVENTGRSFDGYIEVSLSSSRTAINQESEIHYRREASFPGSSRKSFEFTLPHLQNAKYIDVTLYSDDTSLKKERIELEGRYFSSPLVLGIGADAATFEVRKTAGRTQRAAELLTIHPGQIPEHWHAFSGVQMLLLGDADLSGIRKEQVLALKEWVASGGIILISGGSRRHLSFPQVLQEIFPVKMQGIETIGYDSGIRDFLGTEHKEGEEDLFITRADFERGELLLENRELPLIANYQYGKGSIWFFAFGPGRLSGLQVDNGKAIWEMVFNREEEAFQLPVSISGNGFYDPLIKPILDVENKNYPSSLWALVLAGGLSLSFIFLLQKRCSKSFSAKAALYMLLLVPLVFSILSWSFFYHDLHEKGPLNADLHIFQAEVGSDWGMVRSDYIRSRYEKRPLSFQIGAEEILIPQIDQEITLFQDQGQRALLQSHSRWDAGHIRTLRREQNPFELITEEDNAAVLLTNTSPFALIDILLYYRGTISIIGKLEAAETINISMPASEYGFERKFLNPDSLSGTSYNKKIKYLLLENFLFSTQKEDSDNLHIFAWAASEGSPNTVLKLYKVSGAVKGGPSL